MNLNVIIDGFRKPSKFIRSPDDVKIWARSQTYRSYVGFLKLLAQSASGMKISDAPKPSKAIDDSIALLGKVKLLTEEFPPHLKACRYGNPGFRDFLDALKKRAEEWHGGLLSGDASSAIVEVAPYFCESFGDKQRIDYGSGHEANFAAWLYCLVRTRAFAPGDMSNIALRVFNEYLILCRHIQKTYTLEPAGSHGVWGLDDFQFIPFWIGAAQLEGLEGSSPEDIHDQRLVEEMAPEYMYFSCIEYILEVKTGPIGETSPLLNDISAVLKWSKVRSGMQKMYCAEVLQKLPCIQHFLFGNILPVPDRPKDPSVQNNTPAVPHINEQKKT